MIKFLKKLFGPRKLPIDRLLEFTGSQLFYFWNGVNYNDEIMLTKDDYPQHGMNYYTKKDPPPFFKIGFGQVVSGYGDWGGGFDRTAEPLVEMFVYMNDLSIRTIRISNGFYNGGRPSDKLMKKLKKIMKHIRVADKLETTNTEINQILQLFIQTPAELKHGFCITHNGSGEGSFNSFKSHLEWSIKHYKERNPKVDLWIDEDYLKEHNISFPKTRFDTYEQAYNRRDELCDGALKVPCKVIHLDFVRDW